MCRVGQVHDINVPFYCREGLESSSVLLVMRTFFSVQKCQSSQSGECLESVLQLLGLVKNIVSGRDLAGDVHVPEVC